METKDVIQYKSFLKYVDFHLMNQIYLLKYKYSIHHRLREFINGKKHKKSFDM